MKIPLAMLMALLSLFPAWRAMAANPTAPQVWLGGLDPISRHAKYPEMSSDYMDMFRLGAPWTHAAAAVEVFELGPKFVAEAPDDMLSQIFADLKRRNIALAIGASWLPGGGACALIWSRAFPD